MRPRMDRNFTYDEIKDLQVHLYNDDSEGRTWLINRITTLDKFLDLIMPVIKERLAGLEDKR
jgi:hypothetical protein